MLRVKWPKVCIGCGTEDIELTKEGSWDSSLKVSVSGFGNVTYDDPSVQRSNVTSSICASCQKEAHTIIQEDLMPTVVMRRSILMAFTSIEILLILLLVMDNIQFAENLKGVFLAAIILVGVLMVFIILPSYLTSKNEIKNISIPLMKVDQIDKVGNVAFVFRSEKFMKLFKSANPGVLVYLHPSPHQVKSIRMELMD